MSTQNQFSFAAYAAACVAASEVHNGRHSEPVVEKKKRGRKSLWETDYEAAVTRQWGRVMTQLPKSPMKRLRAVPVKLEVVALLTQQGEVVERYMGVVIPNIPKKRGRKSLWETDPEAAACRVMDQWDAANRAAKPKKAKVVGEPKKRGRKSLWEIDYDAAVKRQHKLVMKQLRKPHPAQKVVNKAAKELVRVKAELRELKAELDALQLPQKHSV